MNDAIARVTGAALLALALVGCSEGPDQAAQGAAGADAAVKLSISGAGATFPQPLFERWIGAYRELQPEVEFRYEGVGSGEGIARFLAQTVDFAASDAALSDDELARVGDRGAVMVPVTAGMVVLAYNLPGFDGLQLSREAVVGIFSGDIRSWNDARIQASNPGVVMPNKTLTPVVRRDSSGTTFLLTNHLSAVSEWWRSEGPGAHKRIDWPGNSMQLNHNEGVAQRVKVSQGSIGYMEFEFARRLGLPIAILENRAGEFVSPAPDAGTAALASAEATPEDLRVFVPDPPDPGAYPIVGYSWLLLYGVYPEADRGAALKDAAIWGLTKGQPIAERMGYIPLPRQMVALARAKVEAID